MYLELDLISPLPWLPGVVLQSGTLRSWIFCSIVPNINKLQYPRAWLESHPQDDVTMSCNVQAYAKLGRRQAKLAAILAASLSSLTELEMKVNFVVKWCVSLIICNVIKDGYIV